MLHKALWTLAFLASASVITGCVKYEDDSVQYAAEFYPDENGLPSKGQPQYELAVVLKAGADGKDQAFVPPAGAAAGSTYEPKAEEKLDLLGNYDKKSGQHFMFDFNDFPIAHLNPHRAYSPYTVNGKYTEISAGKDGSHPANFDKKAKKFYRIAKKEAPCWRCGGTNALITYGDLEECPECDDTGFVTYYGVRALKNHKDTDGASRFRAPGKK
jgi:hypothetical protein